MGIVQLSNFQPLFSGPELQVHWGKLKIVSRKKPETFFPNSFSYGVFANIGSGAVPGRLPGGRFRGRFRITGSGKVPGQVLRTTGSRKVPGQVPSHGFREGWGRFRTTGCSVEDYRALLACCG